MNWRMGALRSSAVILAVVICGAFAQAQDDIAVPGVIDVPAGSYITGSDAAEREAAYRLDERENGHSVTRKQGWYDDEAPRRRATLPAFSIARTLITNRQYLAFIKATGHRAPDVDTRTWAGYRLIHPYQRTRKFAWQGGQPPAGRLDHPVVMVSHGDAVAYAGWLTRVTKWRWRLPSEREWEKAARGTEGRRFPWGNQYNARLLNSHDAGPFDTRPVGSYPRGASPFGMLDAAGQVFEWNAPLQRRGRDIPLGDPCQAEVQDLDLGQFRT